jgi:hypothetical protein
MRRSTIAIATTQGNMAANTSTPRINPRRSQAQTRYLGEIRH